MKKLMALLIVVMILVALNIHVLAKNDDKKIGIEIDGIKLGVEAYVVDGSTMVPMRAIFEKLQSEVKWDQETQSVTAMKGSTTVKLTIHDGTALVNSKKVILHVPPMIINGHTVVPLRFVSEALGADVGYHASRNIVSVRTVGGEPMHSDTSSHPQEAQSAQIEPFVVKGRVTDKQGKPLEGVEIIADNQLARDSYQTAITDENGYYQIDLPELNTTWNMISLYEREFEGRVHEFNPTSITDRPFGANKGAIRDFVWDNYNAMVIIDIYDYPDDENLPEFSLDDVELTLTPVSLLIDGSQGKVIQEVSVFHPNGAGVHSVPIAKYEIKARWMPDGIPPMPLLVTEYASEQYAESVTTADFQDIYGTTKRVAIKVKLP